MNLSAAVDRYLAMRQGRGLSPMTVRCDRNDLKRMLAQIGNIKVTHLTKDHLVGYFYGAKGRVNQVEPSTFNAERGRIKTFLEWCVEEQLIEKSPMRGIDRRRVGARERVRLSPAQMVELIEGEPYPRDRMLLSLGCNTGLRAHALTPLRVKDVDLSTGWLATYTSKTDQQKLLPITSDLDSELRRWFTVYQESCGVLHPDWFLVPARHRGLDGFSGTAVSRLRPEKQMCYQTALRCVHGALARLGVDHRGAGTHTLRRSSGRALFDGMVEAGDPRAIHVTREFYGHASVQMTEGYIGTTVERQALERNMRGKTFLSRPTVESEKVVSLDSVRRRRRQG